MPDVGRVAKSVSEALARMNRWQILGESVFRPVNLL